MLLKGECDMYMYLSNEMPDRLMCDERAAAYDDPHTALALSALTSSLNYHKSQKGRSSSRLCASARACDLGDSS